MDSAVAFSEQSSTFSLWPAILVLECCNGPRRAGHGNNDMCSMRN